MTPPKDSTARPALWPRVALVALFVVAIGAFYAFDFHRLLSWESVRANLDDWQEQVRRNLLLALVLYFLVYIAVTALSLPVAVPLSLLGGALFGRWVGTGVISVAATLGATLAFLSSRYLFRDWVQRRFGERLEALNHGVEKEGAYFLFMLRLLPVVPFFLINLGMGLTPMRVGTFAAVSWAGMLLGTFLYVNAGTELATLDSPADLFSWKVLGSLALLGLVPLLIRKFVQWKPSWRTLGLSCAALLLLAVGGLSLRTASRYRTSDTMSLPVREYTSAEYPEDPANRALAHGQYNGRRLTLVKKDDTHFDFVFESDHAHVAQIVFRNVDVSLLTPNLPAWTKDDPGLRRIALTDRQWNRQQVRFGGPGSPHVEVHGGDGWEQKNLTSAELAKNCLNAGLWEVLLFNTEGGQKTLYYQGWFTFPLGHYKRLFEDNTGLAYWQHWYYLEHWFDPAGILLPLTKLREVAAERKVSATFDRDERLIAFGEQARKRRTTSAENVTCWRDFYEGRTIRFASFIPPGRYSVAHPWKNEYRRMERFDGAILRDIRPANGGATLQELELIFSSPRREGTYRFFVSGFDLEALPRLPVRDYPSGMYMPMGIGVPPFFQTDEELKTSPPHTSPYFSVLLDEADRWVDHHRFAIDGSVLHRDEHDPNVLHVYLLSYERHSLIAHVVVRTRP